MCYKYSVLLLITGLNFSCTAQTAVKFNDAKIRYSGRVAMSDSTAVLAWPGTSVDINFKGTGIVATLNDERGDNYYNVIIDGKVMKNLHLKSGKTADTLITGLPDSDHHLELFKRTEFSMGRTQLFSLQTIGGTFLAPPAAKKRKMEYFGDSITCGYADEDTEGKDRGTSTYENGYLSYAALTARHFDAEFVNTSKSGIGVLVSWFPLTMPEMYDRLDADGPQSKWNFNKYTPDLVIINLFQNDSWIVEKPDNEQFKIRFGKTAPTEEQIEKAYAGFVKNVRSKYPKAKIICALGSMDATRSGSPWPGYIEKAISALNDKKIYTHFFAYKNTPGHPSVKEQQDMADDLIRFIDEKVKW